MSCEIFVYYPGLEDEAIRLEILETTRGVGVVSFGSDARVCFGSAPGMGGFVLESWEAQEYGILPRHCALVWAGGKFRLDFDQRAGVYLNGSDECAREFCNPFEGRNEFTMRLGHPDSLAGGSTNYLAPVFKVRRTDQEARKSGWRDRLALRFDWVRKVLFWRMKLAGPAAGLLAVAGFTADFGLSWAQGERVTQALVRTSVPPEVGQALAPSVASIGTLCASDETLLNGRPAPEIYKAYGTAWLYQEPGRKSDPLNRWLVTNAHVAGQLRLAVCKSGRPAKLVAYFPGYKAKRKEILPVKLDFDEVSLNEHPFKIHPLYKPFADKAPSFGIREGQPAAANAYDLAAIPIDEEVYQQQLGDEREYLSFELQTDPASSSKEPKLKFETFLEPGRPVLALGYPTENMPYMATGVSSRPFEFRSTIQSRLNAFSRELVGQSDPKTPAIYSFAARSAGGMSGSPVIALDPKGNPLLVAVVFSGSFVADTSAPEGSAGGNNAEVATIQRSRKPIGDGTYALDSMSLAYLSGLGPDEKEAEELWQEWDGGAVPADPAAREFEDLVEAGASPASDEPAERRVQCKRSIKLALNRNISEEDSSLIRAQTRDGVQVTLRENNPTLVIAHLDEAQGQQLVQLTVRTSPTRSTERRGLGEASYLHTSKITQKATFFVTGPRDEIAVLDILELIPESATCPSEATRIE